jgi:hypothetical protein
MSLGKRFLGGLAAWFALAALAPALASAGSISGTVTAEGGGPIQGVQVCPRPESPIFEVSCDETDAAGHYQLTSLPAAEYRVEFSTASNNLRYVSEYYDDAPSFQEADLFALGEGENATLDAALAEGGSIAGTVTDETTGLPIAGLFICAWDSGADGSRCAKSGSDGEYVVNGLPGDEYIVEFEGINEVNYLREVYDDVEEWAFATKVAVAAPATTSGVDAALAPGGEILGHVSNSGTGASEPGVMVCAMQPEPAEYQSCDWTDSAGDYAIRGLPAGSYLVAFELEYTPWGKLADEWWQGASSAAEADPIVIEPPATRSGIDGKVRGLYVPPSEPEAGTGSGAIAPSPLLPSVKQPVRKCRKGFHRKLVKGKRRCVRKHKPGKHRRHKAGKRNGGRAGR